MGTNKYRPHVLVLPEDDANRQIANGFVLDPDLNGSAIQILPAVGGWVEVVDEFSSVHAPGMRSYPERRIVLIIDFDDRLDERLTRVRAAIPNELTDRVFVLGVLSEPERLKDSLNKSFEAIGQSLSQDCHDNTRTAWDHGLLKHNEVEIDRMTLSVKPFLFKSYETKKIDSDYFIEG